MSAGGDTLEENFVIDPEDDVRPEESGMCSANAFLL